MAFLKRHEIPLFTTLVGFLIMVMLTVSVTILAVVLGLVKGALTLAGVLK